MNCQILSSVKKKKKYMKNIISLSSVELAQRVVKLKPNTNDEMCI